MRKGDLGVAAAAAATKRRSTLEDFTNEKMWESAGGKGGREGDGQNQPTNQPTDEKAVSVCVYRTIINTKRSARERESDGASQTRHTMSPRHQRRKKKETTQQTRTSKSSQVCPLCLLLCSRLLLVRVSPCPACTALSLGPRAPTRGGQGPPYLPLSLSSSSFASSFIIIILLSICGLSTPLTNSRTSPASKPIWLAPRRDGSKQIPRAAAAAPFFLSLDLALSTPGPQFEFFSPSFFFVID